MLEKFKKENCLTNKELAKMLNVSEMTVYRVLHKKSIGPKVIKSIAKLLNTEVIKVYEYYKQL